MKKIDIKFTGKKLDEEISLYYYGARCLDLKYSRWLRGDPVLNDYMTGSSVGAFFAFGAPSWTSPYAGIGNSLGLPEYVVTQIPMRTLPDPKFIKWGNTFKDISKKLLVASAILVKRVLWPLEKDLFEMLLQQPLGL